MSIFFRTTNQNKVSVNIKKCKILNIKELWLYASYRLEDAYRLVAITLMPAWISLSDCRTSHFSAIVDVESTVDLFSFTNVYTFYPTTKKTNCVSLVFASFIKFGVHLSLRSRANSVFFVNKTTLFSKESKETLAEIAFETRKKFLVRILFLLRTVLKHGKFSLEIYLEENQENLLKRCRKRDRILLRFIRFKTIFA